MTNANDKCPLVKVPYEFDNDVRKPSLLTMWKDHTKEGTENSLDTGLAGKQSNSMVNGFVERDHVICAEEATNFRNDNGRKVTEDLENHAEDGNGSRDFTYDSTLNGKGDLALTKTLEDKSERNRIELKITSDDTKQENYDDKTEARQSDKGECR